MWESLRLLNGLGCLNIEPRLHRGHFIVKILQIKLGTGLLSLITAKVQKQKKIGRLICISPVKDNRLVEERYLE
jgi:hypothetical protein